MSLIRALVVDDSVVFRSQISAALGGIPGVVVAGVAATGKIALQKMLQDQFDLIILDLEMPEMSGIQLLAEMQQRSIYPKVIVFSSFSERGAEITLDALRLGASDFVTKPTADSGVNREIEPSAKIRRLLSEKIQTLFHEEIPISGPAQQTFPASCEAPRRHVDWESFTPKVIVIGSSTGGPSALEEIFSKISGPFGCPILIAQHMPPVFTASLAERIERICKVPAAEGKHLEILEPNRIYVAPGDFHLRLSGFPDVARIHLDQGALEHSVRPAVDPLFVTAAGIFGETCLGIILTGMGEDGKIGSRMIKNAGGKIVVQNQASSVVYGMPGAIVSAGTYDEIADLHSIASIIRTVSSGRKIRGAENV